MAVYHRGRSRRRYVLVLLVLTAVTLVTLDRRSDDSGALGVLGRAAHEVVSPVAEAVDGVVSPVADWFDGIFSAGSLESENERLREELAEVKGRVREADEAIQENRYLSDLLDLEYLGDIDSVTARVVQASLGNFEWTITLSKGSDDGVAPDMPVVATEGLVGLVTEVWSSGATVRLLTDPLSGVSVRMVRGRVTGEAEGRAGRSTLALDIVGSRADLVVGDDAVTSGLQGSLYPAGIPVGEIASVDVEPGGLLQNARLRPFVDFGSLEYVRVLRYSAPSGPPPTEAGA